MNAKVVKIRRATIKDARERLLAPGGTLLPLRDTIKVALANSPRT